MTTGDYYCGVKSVGIKQLKARLSEYVRLARSGEVILVSDRDEVVAELGPPRHQRVELGSLDAKLDQLAARGQVTRAGHPKKGWVWSSVHLGLPERAVGELLDDLRDDR